MQQMILNIIPLEQGYSIFNLKNKKLKMSTLILDNGSGCIKAGYNNDRIPNIYYNLIGSKMTTQNRRTLVVSNIAVKKERLFKLNMEYPCSRGIVFNWDYMEIIWKYVMKSMKVNDNNVDSILFTEPLLNPKYNRDISVEMMFEKFGYEYIYVYD